MKAKPDNQWWYDVTMYYIVWHTTVMGLQCPFSVYQAALEAITGEPVWTHEMTKSFAIEALRKHRNPATPRSLRTAA